MNPTCFGGEYWSAYGYHLGYVEVGCTVQATPLSQDSPMLAFHTGGWVCAGHSVSGDISGHKDIMQVGDWDAVRKKRAVDICGDIGWYREGCSLMRLRE